MLTHFGQITKDCHKWRFPIKNFLIGKSFYFTPKYIFLSEEECFSYLYAGTGVEDNGCSADPVILPFNKALA